MMNFRWRSSWIISSVIWLDTMLAFYARFSLWRFQPFCSVGFAVRLLARVG